jgi:hypothetical protein
MYRGAEAVYSTVCVLNTDNSEEADVGVLDNVQVPTNDLCSMGRRSPWRGESVGRGWIATL